MKRLKLFFLFVGFFILISATVYYDNTCMYISEGLKDITTNTGFPGIENAGLNESIVRVVDLDIDEEVRVTLHDGSTAVVKVLGIEEHRESVTRTMTEAMVKVEINGERAELVSSSYILPVMVGGVQVDVPFVSGYMADAHIDFWMLRKAARLRLWPAGSPWIEPGTFTYPVIQRWLASNTWYSNEPVSRRATGKVYYHSGMDFGGAEGLTEIVAATDGVVITIGEELVDDEPHPAARPRYDVIYIEDERGWIYRYSHLKAFDPSLRPGSIVRQGERLGYVGKEGGSGGWAHLHFHIESLQPSGEWGHQDSYAFIWQAYIEEYDPNILAVARPQQNVLVGETVILDASRSWAKKGISSYEWIFTDGMRAIGATASRVYDNPGTYSEIVKVTDADGNIDYDFARINVFSDVEPDGTASIVGLHVAHHPTFGVRPGDPVIFLSRGRRTGPGDDIYDFGDGSPKVSVPSNIDEAQHAVNGYGAVVHHYQKPGHYIIRVERLDEETGYLAVEQIHVEVNP